MPKLVGNPPSGCLQQPGLERTSVGSNLKILNSSSHRCHCFLHDILSLSRSQPRFKSKSVNQLPISVEELFPARLIIQMLHAPQQAVSRSYWSVPLHYCSRALTPLCKALDWLQSSHLRSPYHGSGSLIFR